ncbi:MAG: recombinase family protein [Rhodobacteraceae bacterium]|nr:recombinase family protein [Paracoccaceae bacterium]
MSAGEKITARHLERRALIYIRQSTPTQVITNRESTERQYALANEARALGWHDDLIETVDADQGRSGSFAGERGRVGAVFGLEVTRLARNPVEWFQLLDWCRMTDTLLVEGEQVYSPARHDDNLVLSIKGTLSESEAFLIRTRLQSGIRNKAARGELYHHIPIGYVLEGTSLHKDPDMQVRHAIDRVFSGFQAHGSARQAIQALRDEGVRLPSRQSGSDAVVWSEARYEYSASIRFSAIRPWGAPMSTGASGRSGYWATTTRSGASSARSPRMTGMF